MERVRISYAKSASLRYTGNLDVHRIWERALRRAGLPLAYSQGFHPQPRINQAAPLPLGLTSRAELVDVWLEEDIPVEEVLTLLQQAAPPGLEIQNVALVNDKEPSLPAQVSAAEYRVILLDPCDADELAGRVQSVIEAVEIHRERRGKSYDLRPLIEALEFQPLSADSPNSIVRMRLAVRENATGRPDEVLLALGLDPASARIERTCLLLRDI